MILKNYLPLLSPQKFFFCKFWYYLYYFNINFYFLFLRYKKKKSFVIFSKFYIDQKRFFNYYTACSTLFNKKKQKQKFLMQNLYLLKKQKNIHQITNKRFFSNLKINYEKKKVFNLHQRIFTSKKTLAKNFSKILFKSWWIQKKNFFLKKKKTVIFINAHKSLIWKMRKARFAHWAYRLIGKLNERKYYRLLGTEFQTLTQKNSFQFLGEVLLSSYSTLLSWRHLDTLIANSLVVLNGRPYTYKSLIQKGDIIELPFWLKKRKTKKSIKTLFWRAKKVFFRFFKTKKYKNIETREYMPKIFKRLFRIRINIDKYIAQDFNLNIIIILYKLPSINNNIKTNLIFNTVIGLQNWKYKFD